GTHVSCRKVAKAARIVNLVDGLLDQVTKIDAVRIVPQEFHHVREIAIVHQRDPRRDRVGDHDAARLEPAITGGNNWNEHPFVDAEASEPLRYDHIDAFGGLDVQDISVDHLNDLLHSVGGGQLLRQNSDLGLLDRIDARSAGPRREHAQDAAPGPDVENDVAGAHHRVNCTSKSLGANAV